MTDRELLELLLQKFSSMENSQQAMQSDMKTMQSDMKTMQSDMKTMQSEINTMQADMTSVKANMATKDELAELKFSLENRVDKLELRMESEVIDKIRVLFDGFQLHTEQLQRIEDKLGFHDELIFKRIK